MRVLYKFFVAISFIFFIFGLSVSCNSKPKPSDKKEGCRYGTFDQDFKSDVAWIVLEWSCKPVHGGWGSGFLIDKELGAFYTNKHVANMFNNYGKGSHKIFFNSRVYNAEVIKVPPLRDAAVFRITDKFDPSEFPEPAPFATEKVKKGDRVNIYGFHPHPYSIIEANKNGSYDEKITNIWEGYYNLGTRQLDKKQEVVFEKINGRVIQLDSTIRFEDSNSVIDDIKDLSNTYTIVRTDNDHKFSFGGLSGTVIKNIRGEVVGMVTLEKANFKPDIKERNKNQDGVKYLKRLYDTIGFTPIESIADLKQYLDKK